MPFTRTLVAASAVTATLSLAACGGSDSGGDVTSGPADFGQCDVTSKANTIKVDPVKSGTLTLQTSLPADGWFNGTTPESIKDGFEYCMAAELANMAGLKSVTVKNVSFDAIVAGRANTYDIALAQISITPEREKVVDFSVPYYGSTIGVLAKEGAGLDETNIASKRCAAVAGTTAVTFIKDVVKCQDARVFSNVQGEYQAIISGQVDAAFGDLANLLAQASNVPGQEVVGQFETGEKYGAIFPEGSANRAGFDEGIKTLVKSGTIDELSGTYLTPVFGGDPASVPTWTVN